MEEKSFRVEEISHGDFLVISPMVISPMMTQSLTTTKLKLGHNFLNTFMYLKDYVIESHEYDGWTHTG